MAKETQKAKIERLEKELLEANNIIKKQNNEILTMQDNADKGFNNSPDYIQMAKRIKDLELKEKVLNDSIEHNKKMYKYELKRNDELIKEIQKLNSERDVHNLINKKKHNERGAGRKAKFTEQQIEEIKMYRLQGKTIKEISNMFKCSVGLIHKLINEKKKTKKPDYF